MECASPVTKRLPVWRVSRRRASTSLLRTVRAVAHSIACERRRSSSSANSVLMSSDGVPTLRARISWRNRAAEIRTVIARRTMHIRSYGSVLALSNARTRVHQRRLFAKAWPEPDLR